MSKLRELRNWRGKSAEDVAALVGVTRESYLRIEREEQRQDLPLLRRIADFLNVTVGMIAGEPAPLTADEQKWVALLGRIPDESKETVTNVVMQFVEPERRTNRTSHEIEFDRRRWPSGKRQITNNYP